MRMPGEQEHKRGFKLGHAVPAIELKWERAVPAGDLKREHAVPAGGFKVGTCGTSRRI